MAITTAALFIVGLASASSAVAFSQNRQLERQLNDGDPAALALFPAKGFKDGAAGFFRAHRFYIVPGSQRAWCQDTKRGALEPGCYVEFFFQSKGLIATTTHGEPCGRLGRWHRPPGAASYVPTPGAFYSRAMADGDWESVLPTFDDDVRADCASRGAGVNRFPAIDNSRAVTPSRARLR